MTDTTARSGEANSESIAYRFGKLQFDPARYELRADGQIVDAQRKPLEVLAVLLAHAGEVVTKQELIKRVWNNRPLVDNVVASTVTRLRLALGAEAGSIVTHHRIGYRFAGRVERFVVQPIANAPDSVPIEPQPLADREIVRATVDDASSAKLQLPGASRVRRRWLVAATGVGVAAVSIVLWVLMRLS
jgi:DNA-binding winged helix-turn-helix (wHTH) protein